eukprot:TRINITY_DN7939_c0_g1_i2.p1 TRINITY_DN7939_c0_g1~~TRINITY_DN7939_c0_g1_i2.p1  ORF type:complete len:431 (+),score=99.67 TRINITY_DN7939_c0_g1_i2:28-1293(+)
MVVGRTVLFLNPHFPNYFVNFITSLRNAGCLIVAIGDEPYHQLHTAIRESVVEYYRVNSLEKYDDIYRGVAHLIHHHGRIHWVQSHIEHWLTTEARIREDFNIEGGYLPDELAGFQKKSTMKAIFKELGLKVPQGRVLSSHAEALDFVCGGNGVGFPVVVKPDNGAGATNTFKLDSKEDLTHFFETCFKEHPGDYIFEEFIVGQLHTFDGLMSRDGSEMLYCGSLIYEQGMMESANDQEAPGVYAYIEKDPPQDLIEIGKKLAKAFHVRGHFFHFELFRTPKQELVVLEVNLRLGGGYNIDMYNYGYDANFYQLWADVVAGNNNKVDEWIQSHHKQQFFVAFASRRYLTNRTFALSNDDILSRCVPHRPMQSGQVQMMQCSFELPTLFRSLMGDVGYLFRSLDQVSLFAIIGCIMERTKKQ